MKVWNETKLNLGLTEKKTTKQQQKLWSLIDGAAATAALQRTRAYYLHIDDLTQFDLHMQNCRASASGFVYRLIDQRAPMCLCLFYVRIPRDSLVFTAVV